MLRPVRTAGTPIMRTRSSFVTCHVLVALLSGPALAATETPPLAAVDAVFADLDSTHSPGCALGVYRRGEITLLRGWGMASLEHGVPVDADTVFYAGSVSKQFTAAAVILAAREGHLSLDDPIRRWFPELPAWADPIRVDHLLHHTSGLRDYLTLMALAGVPFETPVEGEWILDLVARQEAANFAAGTEYLYSNTGYFLLGRLVERATGRSLRAWTDARIFEPLAMTSTRFHDDRTAIVDRRALAYAPDEAGDLQVRWSPAFDHVGGGGLLTTARDLARWDATWHDGSLGEDFWPTLTETKPLADGTPLDYAHGVRVDTAGGHRRIQHGGAMFGYRAQLSRFPDAGLTVAVLCNAADADPQTRARTIAGLYLPGADTAPEDDAAAAEPAAATASLPAEPDAWVGRYASAELDAVARIERVGEALHYRVGLAPATPLTFHYDGSAELPRGRATPALTDDGRVASFAVDAGRVRGITFRRSP
jgi:CubicO group peptidase (beta-lactamase class C family)